MITQAFALVAAGAVAGLVLGAALALAVSRSRPGGSQPAAAPTGAGATGVLEALPVAVMLIDATERVLLANRVATDLGLARRGAVASLPRLRQLVREARVHGRPYDTELEPLERSGRSPVVLRARVAPLGDGTVAALLEDVTDARRLEDVRRDFVANVSHELKTPTAALELLSEALQQAADDPDAVRRFANRSQHESRRLSALIQDLVALSRIEGAEPQPEPQVVPLDRVVAEAVDRVRTTARARSISLVRSGHRGLQVCGSESQLAMALGNLLENAVTYSPDGARVVVGAQLVREPGGTVIEVNVVDEGIGIPAKDVERVFERFYRADPARARDTGGTGLGLAIVKHVATNHGGSVAVRSIEGFGSTFTLRLPAASAEESA